MDSTRYPNIADHGLIGELQTAALVSDDGRIDWFCCPRFDSPSIFASLLDFMPPLTGEGDRQAPPGPRAEGADHQLDHGAGNVEVLSAVR